MGRGSFRRFDFREERVRNFAIGWSGEEGERKGKENLSVVVFFSRGRISVTENTGDHRSAWTGSGRFKKSLEKNRARAAMRLLLKINEASRSLPRTDGR